MSLTSFVDQPKVRQVFNKYYLLKQEFKPSTRPTLKAAPISKNYAQVVVAFDYLFRFYLERLNFAYVIDFGWSALGAFRSIEENSNNYIVANEIIVDVKSQKQEYIKSGLITDDLLHSVLRLSTLEPIYRANRGFEYIGRAAEEDINDLKQLISLVNQKDWIGQHRCWLNPRFNAALLVGGADADIVLDDMLIEIKTVKTFCISRSRLNQLIGYYLLDCINGINDSGKPSSIKRFGIYFSRYGYFWSIKVEDLISKNLTEKIIFWWSKILSKQWQLLNLPQPEDPRVIKTSRLPTPQLQRDSVDLGYPSL